MADIEYADLVLLNGELGQGDSRYHVRYKDGTTACLEPPGECCQTAARRQEALDCIRDYYRRKRLFPSFSEDGLYFSLSPLP